MYSKFTNLCFGVGRAWCRTYTPCTSDTMFSTRKWTENEPKLHVQVLRQKSKDEKNNQSGIAIIMTPPIKNAVNRCRTYIDILTYIKCVLYSNNYR